VESVRSSKKYFIVSAKNPALQEQSRRVAEETDLAVLGGLLKTIYNLELDSYNSVYND
jgi:hypothetical protein